MAALWNARCISPFKTSPHLRPDFDPPARSGRITEVKRRPVLKRGD